MKTEIVSIMAVCFCALSAPPAKAAIVTIEIEAEIDSVSDPYNFFDGNIKVGDIIKGTYTYDSTTQDSATETWLGKYEYSQYPYGMILEVGGFRFEIDSEDMDFTIYVSNDRISPRGDIYSIVSNNNIPLSNGTPVESIWWQLNNPSGTALSSDALTTIAPVLEDWQENRLAIYGPSRGVSFGIGAHVTSAIPEPGTLLLFGLGCLLLRKRK